jgi:hypothetical protein
VRIDDETYSAASNLHPDTNCKKEDLVWSIGPSTEHSQSTCEATIDSDGTVTFGPSGEVDDVGILCGEIGDNMKLAIGDVRIEYMRTDGNTFDVTDPLKGEPTAFSVRAGQQIYLKLTLKPEMTRDHNNWRIPTRAIEYYKSTADKGEVIEIKDADLSQDTIRYYWCDAGRKTVILDVDVTINGQSLNFKRTATFDVVKPEITFNGKLSLSTFISNDIPPDKTRSVATHLGTFTRTGDPAGGKCAWTQIVGFAATVQPGNRTYSVEGVDDTPTDPDNIPGVPFAWHDFVQFSAIHPAEISYSVSRNFDLWLMYQCELPGSIWIPLAKGSWLTRANATWNGEIWVKGAFSPSTTNLSPPVESSPTDQFPLWDKRVTAAEIREKLGLNE